MPAKSTTKKSTKTSATPDKPVRSALPRIRAAGAAAPAPKAEPPPAPVAPKVVETLSLIDEKPPEVKRRAGGSKPVLPPISRTMPAATTKPVKPLTAPAPPVEPAPASPAETTPEPPAVSDGGDADLAEGDQPKVIHIKPPIVVKDLAEALGLRPFMVIRDLMEMSIFANSNQTIEPSVASAVCEKYGFVFEKEKRKTDGGVHKTKELPVEPPPPPPTPEAGEEDKLETRPPIITFMGHVDHGKTSLMDFIRRTKVTAGEAGGITQHIGAYSVEHQGHRITFLDTPGHAAFTAMRARGANVTDIVVLVVAADDGIMPQTIEALNHAKAAGVKIIVAINKVDLPQANVDRVKQQLQEHDLAPDDWGGQTVCCPVSATKGTGVDHLLEMMTLEAQLLELRSSPAVPARGTVIEAEMESGRGPTGTVIVSMGTLRPGQAFICGNQWGKVKSMLDDLGRPLKQAGPSTPVKIIGFNGLPNAGDELVVMKSERDARLLSEERLNALRQTKLAAPKRATLESLFSNLADNQRKVLNIVLKADVQGSLEAIETALRDIKAKQIDLEIIHSAVGPIAESDVLLATASDAIIVGFGVKTENSAAVAAKREGVQIKLYSIIYELIDQIKEAMAGLLDPELRETVIGHAEVRQVFDLSRGIVAGCMVTDGRISRSARARVIRKRQPIYDGGVSTLRRFKDDVKEVRTGLECGIRLGDYSEYEVGDIIECYTLEKVAQKLE